MKKKTTTKKLPKSSYPSGHSPNDFQCFGPVATKDGEFTNTKMADLCCFKQDKVDSNKYYHAAVVKSKVDSSFFCYFEWGRIGSHIDFQFLPCDSEAEAQLEYERQLHKKNDKRGVWEDNKVLGKVLRPKSGKDVYLVNKLSARSHGLPDAKNIGAPTKPKTIKKKKVVFDKESDKLLRDLNAGGLAYTRNNIVGGLIPSEDAIKEAKLILDEAVKVNNRSNKSKKVGEELLELTSILYSKIPKIKPRNAETNSWILNPDNISKWVDELDVYEQALKSSSSDDVVADYPFELSFLPFNSSVGRFVKNFFERGTRNRHSYIQNVKVKNIWKITKDSESRRISNYQNRLGKVKYTEVPLHQPKSRIDIEKSQIEVYNNTNTRMLFHGTRSVNVVGILDKSFILPNYKNNITITGAMFGSPALYFADDWKKSCGYTSYKNSYWSNGSGSISNRGAFIFICDVVLGNPYVAPGAYPYRSPPKGHHSIFGKAGFSSVQNNEFIIFDVSATKLNYLIEFE